jgi:CRISPR locus-related DNA-binding protein
LHVAFLDSQQTQLIEQLIVRRPVDEILIFHTPEHSDEAYSLSEKYNSLSLDVSKVLISSGSFQNVLSEILQAIDDRRLDDCGVEFSVSCGNRIMILAACIAAILLQAPIFVPAEVSLFPIKLQPSNLVTLTNTKRRILEHIDAQNTLAYQSDISRSTCISRSCVSRHLRDLEHANYVVRHSRGRKKLVSITKLGQIVLHSKLLRQNRIWANDVSHKTQTYLTAMG